MIELILNAGVIPHVPEKGSLCTGGDLAPPAHSAVVLARDELAADGGYSGQA
jgi:histidine ammonia-lyase